MQTPLYYTFNYSISSTRFPGVSLQTFAIFLSSLSSKHASHTMDGQVRDALRTSPPPLYLSPRLSFQ